MMWYGEGARVAFILHERNGRKRNQQRIKVKRVRSEKGMKEEAKKGPRTPCACGVGCGESGLCAGLVGCVSVWKK